MEQLWSTDSFHHSSKYFCFQIIFITLRDIFVDAVYYKICVLLIRFTSRQACSARMRTAVISFLSVFKPAVKPGFHSNAIACVGKQPIMVATASTEHSYWLALAFVA